MMRREAGRRGQVFLQNTLLMNLISSWLQLKECQGQGKLLTWTWSDEILLLLNILRGLGQVQPFMVEEWLGVFL